MENLSANLLKLQRESRFCDVQLLCSDGEVSGEALVPKWCKRFQEQSVHVVTTNSSLSSSEETPRSNSYFFCSGLFFVFKLRERLSGCMCYAFSAKLESRTTCPECLSSCLEFVM